MKISDNTLAAYKAGVSTVQEDKIILEELSKNKEFSDLLDIMDEIDAIDGMNELRNEFNETIDTNKDFYELKNRIQ